LRLRGVLVDSQTAEWPRFAIFILSFVLIGEGWVNHQSAHWLIWLNHGLLLSVVVIPFATELLGGHALQPGSQLVAAVIYGTTWPLGSVFDNAL
jgi:uncharacterized membrane protein